MSGSMRASFSSLPTASPTMSTALGSSPSPWVRMACGGLRQVDQRFGVAQAAPFGFQLLFLAGTQLGRHNLVDLKAEQVKALRHRARVLAQTLQLAAHLA